MREVIVTIAVSGTTGSGKTKIINDMVEGIKGAFTITAQYPLQNQLSGIDTYTFKAVLNEYKS